MDIFQKCYEYDMIKKMIAEGHYPYFLPLSENEGSVAEYTLDEPKIILGSFRR